MTTKSIFDIPLPLTRAALLRLLKGEHVEHRGSPPGATMIEGVCKVKLAPEITEGERRAICDALTHDVPEAYRHGYAVASWGEVTPVVGSTAWLTMIASNADRIPIRVQIGPTAWGQRYLADCTPEQQAEAMRTWLESGTTPTWEKHEDNASQAAARAFEVVHNGVPVPAASSVIEKTLMTVTGLELDKLAPTFGLERGQSSESNGAIVWREDDAALRRRMLDVHRAQEAKHAPPLPPPPMPPVPAPPAFVGPPKTPAETARERLGFIRWVVDQAAKIGSPHDLPLRERSFLTSCEDQLKLDQRLSDKQTQWLADIHSAARRKASTIAHLLPPVPKFT